jgi:predicted permease
VSSARGAGRGRIVRQLLTESFVLALTGGMIGAALGYAAVKALVAHGVPLPRGADLRVDAVALAVTFAVSVGCGLLFGAAPAVRVATPGLERSLRSSTRGAGGAAGQRLRSALILVEVALAVILAVGASLATKSFARLLDVDLGFQPSHALVVRLDIPDDLTPTARKVQYYRDVLQAIERVPGVVAAGSVRDLPTRGAGEADFANSFGFPRDRGGDSTVVALQHISPDFFKAIGTPVREGREFTWSDDAHAPFAFVINEAAAKRFWPGENPVGKIVRLGNSEIHIIGVVGDIRQRGPGQPPDPTAYISALQNLRGRMSIVIRASGDPLLLAPSVRRAVAAINPNQTIAEVTTLDDVIGGAVSHPKLLALLLGAFGFIGLLLGALGIYGLLAFAVAQRRQEIGVRTALGAPRGAVLRLVMLQGLALAAGGVIAGTLAARVLARQLDGVLFGIAASDVATFVQVIAVLLATALLASWIPARRALAIDPVAALRYE